MHNEKNEFISIFNIYINQNKQSKYYKIQSLKYKPFLVGANKISWVGPTPLDDCVLGVYLKIFLESFE
jgi:hypothetical protein